MKLPSKESDNVTNKNEEVANGNGMNNGSTNSGPSQAVNTVPNSVHDAMLQGAVDAVFRSREQTYEQFLQTFSHLTVGK